MLQVLAGWDIFALSMLCMSWMIFYSCESTHIRKEVKEQDSSRLVSFLIVLVAALFSLLAVIFLLTNKEKIKTNEDFYIQISIVGMALSWFLVHTIFAFRYAHLYYGDDKDEPDAHAAGLQFPEEPAPDYLDFAYFSFVIGMTFQVSDVEISDRNIRRLVLLHGIISFLFNTVVLALSISVIAGL